MELSFTSRHTTGHNTHNLRKHWKTAIDTLLHRVYIAGLNVHANINSMGSCKTFLDLITIANHETPTYEYTTPTKPDETTNHSYSHNWKLCV